MGIAFPVQQDKYTANSKQQVGNEASRGAAVTLALLVYASEFCKRLGQTQARHLGSFWVPEFPQRTLEALGVCLVQPGGLSAYTVLIQVVSHRPAEN